MSAEFERLYAGRLYGLVSWKQLEALWDRLDPGAGWYLYAVGEAPPAAPSSGEDARRFMARVHDLLREEHREDYCGIVFADDLERPSMVKIYDPNNLGVSCGFSKNPPLPGWIMSRVPPADLKPHVPIPGNRRRWWQGLFGSD
jgi:hypothetical protein